MSGIFQGDIFISIAIKMGMEDMRKNPWLIDHMLSDLKINKYASDKYGIKNIDACHEWFKNNNIDVYLRGRDDKDQLPCITIQLGSSNEKVDLKHMADQSTEKAILYPNEIGKSISYIIKPFVPTGYDSNTGEVDIDPSIDLSIVSSGMILVNPSNGNGYVILSVGPNLVTIEPNLQVEAEELGILPSHQYYEARVEHTFFQESYVIGCHAHGDAQNVLFLWSIVLYSILRYRESLLEANGFAESTVGSGGPDFDEAFTTVGGEKAWARFLTLEGQIENSWIKAPRRFIESVQMKSVTKTSSCTTEYSGGIKILSNLDTPSAINQSDELWTTVEDSEDED